MNQWMNGGVEWSGWMEWMDEWIKMWVNTWPIEDPSSRANMILGRRYTFLYWIGNQFKSWASISSSSSLLPENMSAACELRSSSSSLHHGKLATPSPKLHANTPNEHCLSQKQAKEARFTQYNTVKPGRSSRVGFIMCRSLLVVLP